MSAKNTHLLAAKQSIRAAEILMEQDRSLMMQARLLVDKGFYELKLYYDDVKPATSLPTTFEEALVNKRVIENQEDVDTHELAIRQELDVARSIYRLLCKQERLSSYQKLARNCAKNWKVMLGGAVGIAALLTSVLFYQQRHKVWHYEYFVNADLAGEGALQGWTKSVRFDWGTARPAPGIPDARFSKRLRSCLKVVNDETVVQFSLGSDDGSRLYLDGVLLIEEWREQAFRYSRARKVLDRGHYLVSIEYYDAGGLAALTGLVSVDGAPLADMTHTNFQRPTPAQLRAGSCKT